MLNVPKNQLHPFVDQGRVMAGAAIVATLLLAPVAEAEQARRGSIVLHLRGVESRQGNVLCALFERDRWLDTPVVGIVGRYTSKGVVCRFDDVPFGRYGIAAFHDEDDDGEMDNFLGIPSEPYGFSRNASGSMGPPGWKAASFRHHRAITTQRATLD